MIEELVNQIEGRFAELERQMSDPEVIADRERYAEVGREYRELEPAHGMARRVRPAKPTTSKGPRSSWPRTATTPSCESWSPTLPAGSRSSASRSVWRWSSATPTIPRTCSWRSGPGTGGDEAALFAGDLFKMLTRYAEQRGFGTEVLSQSSPAEVGGFKEVTFAIKGEGAYSVFKFEGGTHRVQRVPKTESQGRRSTPRRRPSRFCPRPRRSRSRSTRTIFRSTSIAPRGPGGQSVNTTDSAVRITHKPTGIVVSMQDEKSQLQNRDKAMRVLRARLYEQKLAAQRAEIASERRSQVGSGERSEKIRTYNFPQNRVDRSSVNLTAHNLDEVLGGDLREFTDALAAEEKRELLAAQTAEPLLMAAGGRRGPGPRGAGGRNRRADAAGVDTPRLDAELLLGRGHRTRPGAAWRPSPMPRSRRMPRGASARWCGAGLGGSRSPTSSAARAFDGLELAVDGRALIPRPETELLVEIASSSSRGAALDVGTGSGAVALAIADELPDCEVTATETSGRALGAGGARTPSGSASTAGFARSGGRCPMAADSIWCWPTSRTCETTSGEGWRRRSPCYEPREALVAGTDGIEAIASVTPAAVAALAPGGSLALEVGAGQAGRGSRADARPRLRPGRGAARTWPASHVSCSAAWAPA